MNKRKLRFRKNVYIHILKIKQFPLKMFHDENWKLFYHLKIKIISFKLYTCYIRLFLTIKKTSLFFEIFPTVVFLPTVVKLLRVILHTGLCH